MLKLTLENRNKGLRVLCLGAHCDDIEIGCGGTLLSFQSKYNIAEIRWVVFASSPERALETRAAANEIFSKAIKSDVSIYAFRDTYLRESWGDIKTAFEEHAADYSPDIIFTHHGHDKHQDHRLVSELTWNTYRNHLILEYEIPKYDGDLGQPNIFVPLTENEAKRKVDILGDAYGTQKAKQWFDAETFYAVMRLRGLECGGPQKYAEGFHLRKGVI